MNDEYKILWVEDEEHLREVMCELIASEGYHCTPAEDGLAARELLEKEQFDLIITDFNMPRMNGPQLLFWCRENHIHQPFIFVTANVDRLPVEELVLNDCCCSVVNKPFSVETILEEIVKARHREHEFDCNGSTVPPGKGDFQDSFPGQHIIMQRS